MVPVMEGLAVPPLALPAELAGKTKEELDEVASAISAMAGKPCGADLASSIGSVASTPRGGGQEAPTHHKHTGLGCPADYCVYTTSPQGELVMTDRFQTSRPSLSR